MVQATRAIYIDFENLPFEQPSLLGYVCEGKWNVAIDAQGQSMQSLMTVTQKGDSVSGTTESQIGTANFDGVVKGDSIFFGFAYDMGGQQIKIRGTGVMFEKDKMTGTMEAEGLGAFPFAAARQPN